MLLWRAENFHYASQLLLLVLARKDGIACEKFGKDTAQRPHVYWHTICHAQNDLRRPVEARLDVSVNLLVFETAGAKVDNFDF